MYGNYTKHKILIKICKYLVDNRLLKEFPFDYIALRKICNIEDERFGRYMSNLQTEGFVTIGNLANDTASVNITKRGISAATSDYFLQEQRKLVLGFVRDFALITCNIVIAIAAVKALNRDATNERKELEALREQVNLIKLQLPLKHIEKDTVYLLNKDSLKTSKVKNQ